MSTIAGIHDFSGNIESLYLKKMANSLSHRLQKYEVYNNYGTGLIFQNEENIYHEENFIICFTGNLYNFSELKKNLSFEVKSIAHLIYHLYKTQGKSFFSKLEGSFIFIISDKQEKEVYIVRDQIGEKAIYYWYKSGKVIFASEIKAILENPEVKREVNLGSMEKYFTFSYVPGENTMIKEIKELLPACYLKVTPNEIKSFEYWSLSPENKLADDTDENQMIKTLSKLLEESVKKRLPSENEPLGLFLSGGIDSSLVAAISQKLRKDPINTYSIHFGKNYNNELYYSSMVANHIKSNHHIVEIKPKNFLNEMINIIGYLDDPIGDPITVPNFLLAKTAKKDVSVIFNGEGGDPCFGGPKNIPMMLSQLYSTETDEYALEKYYLKSYKKCYDIIPEFFSNNLLENLKNNYQPMEVYLRGLLDNYKLDTFLDKLMYLNTKLKGTHHILVKVEKMTSANGLDAIAPIFSPDVAQYSFAIPAKMKLNGRIEKYILKKSAESLLPHEVVYREKKGMMVPVKYWFEKDMKKYAKKILSEKNIKSKGYFNYNFVKDMLNYNLDTHHKSHTGLKLWMLITFEIWHQIFIEKNY